MKIVRGASALALFAAIAMISPPARAADPKEEDYYKILTFEPPKGEVLEAGAIEMDARRQGRRRHPPRRDLRRSRTPTPPTRRRTRSSPASPTACTRCSAWPIATAGSTSPSAATSRASRTPTATARPTCSRSSPTAGRSAATITNTPSARSSTENGNLWVALCLTGSFTSDGKFRGWACEITPDGKFVPTTSGVRSPGGDRHQRRGRRVLHRQPGPLERRVRPQAPRARRRSSAIPTASSWYKTRRRILGATPRGAQERQPAWPIEAKRIPQAAARRPSTSPTARWASPPAASTAT